MKRASSRSPEETRALGQALARELGPGAVVGLSGPLGAGKTCFVQGLARGLRVDAAVPVTSPTFTLVAEYRARLPLRHADFYRVDSYERLEDAGFPDLLDGRGVVVVEWPERFPHALPVDRLAIRMQIVSDCERRLELVGCGPLASQIERRVPEPWA